MLNRVVLVGRLTKDPDLRFTQQGTPVVAFTLAVNRTFMNQSGQREADFVNCVAWRKLAENVGNFLRKGSLAGVDGRLQTRNYDNGQGQRVYVTEVVAESVQFLETKNRNGNNHERDNTDYGQNYSPIGAGSGRDQFDEGRPVDIKDDDLPF